jgi:dUTP pyrophosphatase
MEKIDVKIKKIDASCALNLPQQMSIGASGLDLCVNLKGDIILHPLERALVPTGIAVSIPTGYEGQVRPRSGLAIKHGITLLNSPGTIDSDYRGEIKLIVINLSNQPYTITSGMRLAQMIICQVAHVEISVVDNLDQTSRGAGGFGHTGI